MSTTDQELLDYLIVDQGLSRKWAQSLVNRKNKFLDWLEDQDYPTDPEKIPKVAFREYHNYMIERYASQTVRKRLSSIRRWLELEGVETIEKMKFRTPEDGRIERPYYSQEQASKIWRTSKEMGSKYHSLIALNLGMGLRRIGTYRARWGLIDLEDRTMTVIGKSKKKRTLIIPQRVREILESWRIKQAKKWGSCQYVMTKRGGERPNRRKTLGDWLNKILDKAGVSYQDGFRAGRRRFGRDLYIATNYDIVAVSDYLGHASTTETRKYLELKEHTQREAVRQLDMMIEKIDQEPLEGSGPPQTKSREPSRNQRIRTSPKTLQR